MSNRLIPFPRLASKGFQVSIPLLDEVTWKRVGGRKRPLDEDLPAGEGVDPSLEHGIP